MKTHIDITPLVVTSPGGRAAPGLSPTSKAGNGWARIMRKGICPHLPFLHIQTRESLGRNRDKEKRDSSVPSQTAGRGKAPVLGKTRS